MCIYVCVCLQRVNPEGFKKVTEVAKAGAIKWGALTPEEKKPYEEDAAQRKVRACVCVHMHVCHIVRVAAYDSSSSYSDQTTLRFPVPRPRENCMCEWRALTTPLHVHACVCVCVCVCVAPNTKSSRNSSRCTRIQSRAGARRMRRTARR